MLCGKGQWGAGNLRKGGREKGGERDRARQAPKKGASIFLVLGIKSHLNTWKKEKGKGGVAQLRPDGSEIRPEGEKKSKSKIKDKMRKKGIVFFRINCTEGGDMGRNRKKIPSRSSL